MTEIKGSGPFLAVAVVVSLAVTAGAQRAWPPPVQKVTPHSPPLSPADERETFFLPPGYGVELVASEPMVVDPIAIDFDPDGRMWVVEMLGFMPDSSGTDSREPTGRIAVLEDRDDDGAMDHRTVFLDKLILPRSIKVLHRGVLVAEPPNLWLARDTDGDLKADEKKLIRSDYGRLEGNPEHNANGFLWGLDNVIYTSEHTYHLELKNGEFRVQPTLLRGQWGVGSDDAGRIYRNWNEQPLFVDYVAPRYYTRNPNLARTRGLYEILMDPKDMTVWPVRPTRGVNRGYRDGVLRADGTLTTYVSAGTPTIYRGDRLPQELYGNAFITESAGNLVHRLIVEEDAAGRRLSARNAYPKGEFLASTDERFRPVNLFSAPDGTLYVVDMYRGVIQDGQYWTDYLRDYIKTNKLELPVGLGRIWRVVHQSTKRDRKPALSKASATDLVTLLAHPNGWHRDTGQRLLVERREQSVTPALRQMALTHADWRARIHALWTLDGIDAIDETTVERALADTSAAVRASAVRLSERWLATDPHGSTRKTATDPHGSTRMGSTRKTATDPHGSTRTGSTRKTREGNATIKQHVLARMTDAHWSVRRQLAATAGVLPAPERLDVLTTILREFGADPLTVDVAISGLARHELDMLKRLLAAGAKPHLKDAVAMLAAAIARSGNTEDIAAVTALARDESLSAWQREALRLSTGAASAGRRGGTAPGAPLTAEERARFEKGREIYGNLCVACHQPDGAGREKMAPTLLKSRYVVGNPGIPVRIVIAGKEGAVGLMPPLGASLNDEQIAAVLTYIRREWGHTASPVTAADVQEIRGMTASRKRPWTEEEIAKLAGGRSQM